MAYKNPALGRQRDRERFARRTATRVAQGLCPKCGARPPLGNRSLCEVCAEKRRTADRDRAARRRAAGVKRVRTPKTRATERERYRQRTAKRFAQGLCTKCGRTPPEPARRLCTACGDNRRQSERARYGNAMAMGRPYAGRDPEAKRRHARTRGRKLRHARRKADLCIRCGNHPPVEGGTSCEPCRKTLRAAERETYAERRSAGCCGRCGTPTFEGASRCGPCALHEAGRRLRKNAASRRRYAARRASGRCTACGRRPAFGASRCEPCARRSYERSEHVRGLPIYPPSYTVINLATGEQHADCDSWEEVALCLAFERLSLDQVEVIVDQSPMAFMTAAPWE